MFKKTLQNYKLPLASFLFVTFILTKWFFSLKRNSLQCHWKVAINSYRPGGNGMSGRWDLKSCLEKCLAEDYCMSLDYAGRIPGTHSCYLHYTNNTFKVVYDESPGVLHYDKKCGLNGKENLTQDTVEKNCDWKENIDTQGLVAVLMEGVSSKNECRSACEAAWNCGGYNWNDNEFDDYLRCSLTTKVSSTQAIADVTHYTRKCNCVWQTHPNQASLHGLQQTNVQSLKSCLNKCHQDQDCTSCDWNSIQKACTFATSTDVIQQYGIDHYVYICK